MGSTGTMKQTHHHKEGIPMMNVTRIGIDVAKQVFQVHGVDARGTRCCAAGFLERRCAPASHSSGPVSSGWRPAAVRTTGRGRCARWDMTYG
jgi:hypothetical protein